MKKIMIISASNTGHGHKSISESFMEFFKQNDDIEAKIFEGFEFMKTIDNKFANLYGPIVRNAKEIWRLGFVFSRQLPAVLESYLVDAIDAKFMEAYNSFQPDMIVSVHSFFSGSICALLQKHGVKTPVLTMIADLIDLHPLWLDTRVDVTFCPTWESIAIAKSYGLTDEQIIMTGFPTRPAFTEAARQHIRPEYDPKLPIECLIMGGGDGSGNLQYYAKTMLHYFNSNVTIICGRNEAMHKKLTQALKPYGKRARVLGFCTNVQDYMLQSDVLICRGSPNVMMEAVSCAVPMLITGALPGQEQHNPLLMENYNLGVYCKRLNDFLPKMRMLLDNDAGILRGIRHSQEQYRDLDIAKKIANYIMDYARYGHAEFPPEKQQALPPMRFSVVNGRIQPAGEKFITQTPPLVVMKDGKAQLFYIKNNQGMTHKQYIRSERARRLEKKMRSMSQAPSQRRIIKTERLYMRRFVVGDWINLKKMLLDRENSSYASYSFTPELNNDDIKKLARFFAQSPDYLVICRRGDSRIIGYLSLAQGNDYTSRSLEFYIISCMHGQGYGAEALRAAIDHAMRNLDARLIISRAAEEDDATCALLETLGFEEIASSASNYRFERNGKPVEYNEISFALECAKEGENG